MSKKILAKTIKSWLKGEKTRPNPTKTRPKHDQMYDHDQNDHFDREKFMSCRVVSEQNTTDHDQVAFLVVVGADPRFKFLKIC